MHQQTEHLLQVQFCILSIYLFHKDLAKCQIKREKKTLRLKLGSEAHSAFALMLFVHI